VSLLRSPVNVKSSRLRAWNSAEPGFIPSEFFGDSHPSFHFIILVCLYDSFELYVCHPAELQTHESVSGKLYRFDDCLDLRHWDPELSAQVDTEAVYVNFG